MASQWRNASADSAMAAPSAVSIGARHQPLAHAVLDALRNAIIGGLYPQGTRLIEEEIAARYDVSRNPIREALHALSIEGFVVLEPRRGARVASIDARQARELFELRPPLEGLVARLAAARRTAADVERLEQLVDQGRAAVGESRLEELPVLNTEFHGALAAVADNALLAATLARLSELIRWVYAARIRERSEQSWEEHAAIVDAVASGRPDVAERRGVDHIAAALAAYDGGVHHDGARPRGEQRARGRR